MWEPYVTHQEWPPGILQKETASMSNKNFKIGDRVRSRSYECDGTIQEVVRDGYKVKLDGKTVGGMYGDGVYWMTDHTMTRAKEAPAKFAKGDIVTWGAGYSNYEYVCEVDGITVLKLVDKPLARRTESFDNLRKVPPATRTIKVTVDILKEDGKMVAYSASSDEPDWEEPMPGTIKTHTFEIEVPA